MRQFSPLRGGQCRILPDRISPQLLGTCAPGGIEHSPPVRDPAVLAVKTAAELPHCLDDWPRQWMAGPRSSSHGKTNVANRVGRPGPGADSLPGAVLEDDGMDGVWFGYSVAGVGDVNGDRRPDFLVGEPLANLRIDGVAPRDRDYLRGVRASALS
jgi:hypothetical protein